MTNTELAKAALDAIKAAALYADHGRFADARELLAKSAVIIRDVEFPNEKMATTFADLHRTEATRVCVLQACEMVGVG